MSLATLRLADADHFARLHDHGGDPEVKLNDYGLLCVQCGAMLFSREPIPEFGHLTQTLPQANATLFRSQ